MGCDGTRNQLKSPLDAGLWDFPELGGTFNWWDEDNRISPRNLMNKGLENFHKKYAPNYAPEARQPPYTLLSFISSLWTLKENSVREPLFVTEKSPDEMISMPISTFHHPLGGFPLIAGSSWNAILPGR